MPEINRLKRKTQTRQEHTPNPEATTIVSSATQGMVHSSLTQPSLGASVRGTIKERNVGMTVTICQFAKQLLIHIHLRGDMGNFGFLLTWHRQARFVWRHNLEMIQPTEGVWFQCLWS
jgi:hypothetical protein